MLMKYRWFFFVDKRRSLLSVVRKKKPCFLLGLLALAGTKITLVGNIDKNRGRDVLEN